jgi:long-chain acyl-CoA synthetase
MKFNPLYEVKPIADLKDMLTKSVNLFGSKNAFLVKTGDETYNGIKYYEFKNDIDALGVVLLKLGLKDKFIAVIGENRYEWCVTYLAVVNGTGVIVPLDRELPLTEIENLLTSCNASAVVFSGKLDKEINAISLKLPFIKYFINMDATEDKENFLSLKKLINKGKELISSGDSSFQDLEIDADKMSILLFTSGTTDHAKGVMLSHKNICSDLMFVCKMIYIDKEDSSLSILPLHHTYECTCNFLIMMYNGGTLSFNEGLKHIAKNLKETKPSILFLVPLILESMYKKIWEQASKKKGLKTKLKAAIFVSNILYNIFKIDLRRKIFKQIHQNIGGNVRLIISGAAAINPSVSKGFRSMGINVLQGYGLTECSPILTVNRLEQFNDKSAGLPLPGIELKLHNINKDGIGEIIAKGDNIMLGYFNNESATKKVLKDGWFYTGDLACMDENSFIYITGREKNVIVTKNGKKIFPEEVEAYLNKSPYILESLVFGKYDDQSGETYVNSQIVPDYASIKEKFKLNDVVPDDLMKLISLEVKNINKNMPLYKHIRKFTIRETEFAKTTTRKIKRYMAE